MTDNFISLENEIWKPVSVVKGRYLVSNMGRIFCIKTQRISKFKKSTSGYSVIRFSVSNKHCSFFVHRLVMEEFIGKSKLHVDHINRIKTDNRLENLEYVTVRENVRRGMSNSRPSEYGMNIYQNKSKKNPYRIVYFFKGKRQYGGCFSSIEIATKERDKLFSNLGISQ